MTKSINRTLLGALALTLLIPAAGFAQSSDTESAQAFANIVQPIVLTLVTDLNFGDIVTDAVNPGTVQVAPDGTVTPAVVTSLGGTSPATFTVAGENGRLFNVAPIANFLVSGPGVDMAVSAVTSDCGTCTVGTDGVAVGGTLTVGGNQASGLYTGTFDVTVSYQ